MKSVLSGLISRRNFTNKIIFWAVFLAIAKLTIISGFAQQVSSEGGSSEAPSYVGVEKCKVCHLGQYNIYSERRFVKSWKILKMKGEDKNLECLKCHVTGFNKSGGFVSEQQTPNMLGKQCESCHGPGSKHIKEPDNKIYRDGMKLFKKENVCIECHACMKTHRETNF